MRTFFLLLFLMSSMVLWGQGSPLEAPLEGPGSAARYVTDSTQMIPAGEEVGGYWLFLPEGMEEQPLPIVVFLHGYGVFNPMVYGEWIRHLVRQGQAVIFPRYQENRVVPRPHRFAEEAAEGILAGLEQLEERWGTLPNVPMMIVGHSYGGTTAANLVAEPDRYGLPPVGGIMMITPGTSIFRGGVRSTYETIPAAIDLLIVVNERDDVVGERLAHKVFNEAEKVRRKGYYTVQFTPDPLQVAAHHREPYSVYLPYNIGPENGSTRRALQWTELDVVDHWIYWRMMDALSDCVRTGQHCALAYPDAERVETLGDEMGVPEVRLLEMNELQLKTSFPNDVTAPEVSPGKQPH
jgi:pimeloyl-ACP methyl ester carboxylesterase